MSAPAKAFPLVRIDAPLRDAGWNPTWNTPIGSRRSDPIARLAGRAGPLPDLPSL